MSNSLVISVDAMGGDDAPDMVVDGVKLARKRFPDVRFLLFGDEARIGPLVAGDSALSAVCTIRHTASAVSGDAKPSQAVRSGRQSSLWLSIEAVKKGEAAGVVSAGNTGAFMAMAKLILRTLPGIDRPAIATLLPTLRGESVVLDLGANAECNANNLVEFAIMGEVFARTVLSLDRPTVGIMNIGSESGKGTDTVRDASARLQDSALPIRFMGFVEGDDLGKGTVDVIVTDGFTGNVMLKTAEGTAKLYSQFLRNAFLSSLLARLGYLLSRSALQKVKARTDPRRYNGAMFLGLDGVAVKSHGGTDALGFSNALAVAIDLVRQGFNESIKDEIAKVQVLPSTVSVSHAV
ncbi:phosphate acyltransferase PlsX [Rhodospirillum rubrum]|uniref:Phosphate acyltransferase n=1 Tax=Rhodospirillum rubrum (strain ATCC 11170 / ATH 1.1.1 / DSM 467 / LMG 4362 / NCIMB 8255 / S1) TaxID=269796 RepID=PLSX_RHORT|nr:phosphate acyltransferase PlsX [Rhodospirillum rubrum]Q2RTS9.1 RecName: Full=Phosphate acyltransferase; AltName: Full=Acyl-ACP phosphotransacylase; AltName: Full=Acyl-[acyl-carrier-protein]--phosphate acyltransferase; AltName: Full=Phosphate-acyl-ACP acyltransferase [Rhodospirillum rubrum ATCC 11170]ABC22466.1 phosphate:acyl-[acyl carrier protein] acyltransferase [Rhodospirillum rubrum ATCC 11170]MBK1664762.1 phosphate acyltransferase [Rhodospirillum rubrum]MBK1676422.1 phosphate acyltransfe